MNIFGFFATIICCVTVIVVTCIIFSKSFTITHTHKDIIEQKPEERPQMGFTRPEPDKKEKALEEEINKDIHQASMDAVIKSVNELMGIKVEGDANDRKE